jgi:predicted deacylase
VSKREMDVRDISVKPGEKKFCWFKIGEMQDSRPAEVPLILINGLNEGPTLYIEAAQDGAELNPIAVIHKSIAPLDPVELSGRIICVVITNFFAFHSKVNWNPLDMFLMNRFWPGKPDGNNSERIIYQLWNELVLQSDYAMDLHAIGTSPAIDSVFVRVGEDEPNYEKVFQLAKIFGLGYILDEKNHTVASAKALAERKLSWQATVKGIPTITPELCGGRGWIEESIKKGARGVMNTLKHLKMLDGEPIFPRITYVASQLQQVTANRGGFLYYKTELGDKIEKGGIIADITDPFGKVLESIVAPEDGILWNKSEYPMVSSGEIVAGLGTHIREVS